MLLVTLPRAVTRQDWSNKKAILLAFFAPVPKRHL